MKSSLKYWTDQTMRRQHDQTMRRQHDQTMRRQHDQTMRRQHDQTRGLVVIAGHSLSGMVNYGTGSPNALSKHAGQQVLDTHWTRLCLTRIHDESGQTA
ncbi:hypothetical protein PoB_003780000 [Plakobranchus ocellatus]|uniref:Uncharacterized protein n=1 Tax=Plakobranchus ocellatus TaxID=259542 RepID=A0AAV4AWS7_9GAST|nr:hypothetical protein PoB_003780000 [Plakobranchus ocellatus]